jgi:hypothetical protein
MSVKLLSCHFKKKKLKLPFRVFSTFEFGFFNKNVLVEFGFGFFFYKKNINKQKV